MKQTYKRHNWSNILLWIVYLSLLAVLLPHTSWAFSVLEPERYKWASWAAAITFEAGIAVLTHKLARHIESLPKYKDSKTRFKRRYLNVYSYGLLGSVFVSMLANLAHAVEYGQTIKIFTEWSVPSELYAIAFGAILPVFSLFFARVLSNVSDEWLDDTELVTAQKESRQLLAKIARLETELKNRGEKDNQLAELLLVQESYSKLPKDIVNLFGDDKKSKVLAAAAIWPDIPKNVYAALADCSPAYVTQVLR